MRSIVEGGDDRTATSAAAVHVLNRASSSIIVEKIKTSEKVGSLKKGLELLDNEVARAEKEIEIAQNVFDNSAIIANNKTLKIVLNNDLTDVELVLLDLQGRVLRKEDLHTTSIFDLSDLAQGVYLVHLQHKGVIRTEKIVVQ